MLFYFLIVILGIFLFLSYPEIKELKAKKLSVKI